MRGSSIAVVCALAVFAPGISLASSSPIGTFDAAYNSNCQIAGWAKDPDTTAPITVQVFKDGPYQTGTLVAVINADQLRSDLPFPDQDHGFLYTFDQSSGLYDGQTHQLYIYGIDATGDPNVQLNLSPKSIQCSAAPTSVNVKDYGAKGDGVTDDAPAIQKAIDALSASGGEVSLPAGTYMLGTSAGSVEDFPDGQPIQNAIIINKSNVTFEGAGQSTILELMPHTKMRAIAVTGSNVTIENLVVDGDKSQRDGSVPYPGGDTVDALVMGDQSGNNITIENCEVRNGIEDGIGFWKSNNATVQNCYSHDNGTAQAGGAGIALSGGANASATGNRVENNTATGIWAAFGSTNDSIENNTIENNAKGGITIGGFSADLGAGGNSGFTISGNTVSGNGSAGFDGIIIASADNGTISNNTLDNNVYDSLAINDDGVNPPSTGWTVTGNSCSSTDPASPQQWGIRILGRSSGIVLRSNTCENNGTSTADQMVVAGTASVNSDWQSANTLLYSNTSVIVSTPPSSSALAANPSPQSPSISNTPISTAATSSGGSALVASLQAEVASLMAQIAALGGSTSAGSLRTTLPGESAALPILSSATATNCPSLSRTLSFGSTGSDVSQLQQFLSTQFQNFGSGDITGYYGPLTEDAVAEWQSDQNIVNSGSPQTTGWGVAGPKTRAAMGAFCR